MDRFEDVDIVYRLVRVGAVPKSYWDLISPSNISWTRQEIAEPILRIVWRLATQH
jgi:hypothetical protein